MFKITVPLSWSRSVGSWALRKPAERVRYFSVVTCPTCGHCSRESMPASASVRLFLCKHCCELIKPVPGNCCVYCSHGSVPCPYQQRVAGAGH